MNTVTLSSCFAVPEQTSSLLIEMYSETTLNESIMNAAKGQEGYALRL